MYAVRSGYYEEAISIIEYLLSQGADLKLQDAVSQTNQLTVFL